MTCDITRRFVIEVMYEPIKLACRIDGIGMVQVRIILWFDIGQLTETYQISRKFLTLPFSMSALRIQRGYRHSGSCDADEEAY